MTKENMAQLFFYKVQGTLKEKSMESVFQPAKLFLDSLILMNELAPKILVASSRQYAHILENFPLLWKIPSIVPEIIMSNHKLICI